MSLSKGKFVSSLTFNIESFVIDLYIEGNLMLQIVETDALALSPFNVKVLHELYL